MPILYARAMAMSFSRPLLCQFVFATLAITINPRTHAQNWSIQNPRLTPVVFARRGHLSIMTTAFGAQGGLRSSEDGIAGRPARRVVQLVGDHGLIVQSSPAGGHLAIRRQPGGAVEVSCRAEIGTQRRLQGSIDGRVWNDLMTFAATTSDTPYRDAAPSARVRLYRLVSP